MDAIADSRDGLGEEKNPRYWYGLGRLRVADLKGSAVGKGENEFTRCDLGRIAEYLGNGASVELRAIDGDPEHVEVFADRDLSPADELELPPDYDTEPEPPLEPPKELP